MKGFGDMKQLMQQAQRLQEEMAERQRQLQEERVEATAGGGMVRAVVSGQGRLLELAVSPEVVDPAEVEMLQDLAVAAIQEAQDKAQEKAKELMADLGGGLPPGLMP
ncbi:MAG: YbaB/EbfC family nucleoid-associated protein [Candidatus Bipolaricaulota bacterium]